MQLFYLKAPAAARTPSRSRSAAGPRTWKAGRCSFTGVDQTTPVRNIATKFGTGTAPNVTVPSAAGDLVVDALVTGCDGGITSAQTVRWLRQANCDTAGGNGAQSTAAGAASVTMGYTVPSDWWGILGMDVVAAATPAGPFDFTVEQWWKQVGGARLGGRDAVTATLSSGAAQAGHVYCVRSRRRRDGHRTRRRVALRPAVRPFTLTADATAPIRHVDHYRDRHEQVW